MHTKLIKTAFATALGLSTLSICAAAAPFVHPRLIEAVEKADAGDFITVSIYLKEQVTNAEKALIPGNLPKKERRAEHVALYKRVAERSQGPLLEYLEALQREGLAENIRPHWITNTVVVDLAPGAVNALRTRDDIAALHISEYHEGEPACEIAWGVTKIEAPTVWDTIYNFTGEDVVVAMVDTGCRYTHYDIRNHLWVNEDETPDNGIDDDGNGYVDDDFGWDFAFPFDGGDDNDPFHGPDDPYGHGTHTTGTVGSDGTAGKECGVAPDSKLMIIRVPNRVQEGSEERYWTAWEYLTENGADVMSMSMGFKPMWYPDRYSWRTAAINLVDAGVVAAIAAGNEYEYGGWPVPYNLRTPGDVPEIISVGATDADDVIASFSSSGPVEWNLDPPYDDYPYPPGLTKPDVSAPGVDVLSTVWYGDDTYEDGWSGTSMATPHVGGLAALLLEAEPELTPLQVKNLLESSALDLGPAGKDNRYGSGRIRVVEALDSLGANPHPDHFSLVAPEDGAIVPPGTIKFEWEPTTDPGSRSVVSYTLRLSREPDFRAYRDHEDLTKPETSIYLHEGTYYWKVKAIDDEGGYTWCDERYWELVVYEEPTDVLVYDFGLSPSGDGVKLRWYADDARVAGFNLYRTRKFTADADPCALPVEPLNGSLIVGESPFEYYDGALDAGVTYAYTLEAIDSAGKSTTYGPIYGTAGPDVPKEFALYQNRPNPTAGKTVIRFALPEYARVTLDVYDVAGRKVAVVTDREYPAGTYEVEYSADLPPGMYLYRLTAGEDSATKKMLVIR